MIELKDKINFLDWVIVHSIFTRREAYWLLTYLKDHPAILENVHFVEHADKTPRGIIFEQSSHPDACFALYKHDEKVTDHEKIFHDIRLNWQKELYIEVKLATTQTNQLYMSILEDNPFAPWNKEMTQDLIQKVTNNIEELTTEQHVIGLLNAIDEALDKDDMAMFLKLSKTYQELIQRRNDNTNESN